MATYAPYEGETMKKYRWAARIFTIIGVVLFTFGLTLAAELRLVVIALSIIAFVLAALSVAFGGKRYMAEKNATYKEREQAHT